MDSSLNVETTFGPLFVGLVVSAILLGITTVQSGSFLYKTTREPLLHRVVVGALWLLDFLSTSFLAHTLYHFLIVAATPGDGIGHMYRFIWTCVAMFAMESVIISVAQSLYILRIWRLATMNECSRRALMTVILISISTVSLVTGLYTTYRLAALSRLARFDLLHREVFLCLGSTCLADLCISLALMKLLIRRPKATSWTDSTAVVLASYALNTGIFTGLFSLASIIAFAIDDKSYVFLGIRIILSTVHINSLMGMLNARLYFQRETPATVVLQSHDTFLTFSKGGAINASSRRPTTAERDAQPTINEAGFPQFQKSSTIRNQCGGVVEVVVAREQSTTISRTVPLPV